MSGSPMSAKGKFVSLLVIFVILIAASLSLLGYYQNASHESAKIPSFWNRPGYKTKTIHMGGHVFVADVADTDPLQEKGLSGRPSIDEDRAMIFVFPTDNAHLFWMKDMLFSIDIIWLDADKRIAHIARNVAPDSYPQTFGPTFPTRYVIEVQSGIADKIGLKVGDKVSF